MASESLSVKKTSRSPRVERHLGLLEDAVEDLAAVDAQAQAGRGQHLAAGPPAASRMSGLCPARAVRRRWARSRMA